MRIRFFNTYDTSAPFFRDLIPYLESRGNIVELVMSKAEYRAGDDFETATAHLSNFRAIKTVNWNIQPKNGLSKIVVMFLYVIHAAVYSLFGPRVDKNVFLTQPPLFKLWGYILSKIRNQPYYCVVMDIYPEMAVELGNMKAEALLTKFLSFLSDLALKNADGVFVIGRCMADYLITKGIQQEHIYLITNWADERIIYPIKNKDNNFRISQPWKDKFVVLYAGNIGIPQRFDDLLSVAKMFQDEKIQDIVFVFIGEGARSKQIKNYIQQNNLSNVAKYPFLHETYPLAEILSAGDLHFVSLKENITGLAVPSKSYSSFAAGRPIIYQGSMQGEIARMIIDEDIGSVVKTGEVSQLKKEILKYYEQHDRVVLQGNKAREVIEGSYNRAKAIERYADYFENETHAF